MSLSTYYQPFHEPFFTFEDLHHLFDTAWESRAPSLQREVARREQSPSGSALLRPRMDLHESKDTAQMTASFELPGMKKEDINIDIHQNHLTVSGQSIKSDEHEREGYAVHERRFGKFSRTLPIPSGLKPQDVKASMDNGVLTIRFPKAHPDEEPKKIAIQ